MGSGAATELDIDLLSSNLLLIRIQDHGPNPGVKRPEISRRLEIQERRVHRDLLSRLEFKSQRLEIETKKNYKDWR